MSIPSVRRNACCVICRAWSELIFSVGGVETALIWEGSRSRSRRLPPHIQATALRKLRPIRPELKAIRPRAA
jgi:hypothetical protein